MAAGEHFFDRLEERVELAAGFGLVDVLGQDETRMRADLAQARERRQHVHGRALDPVLAADVRDHVAPRGLGDAAVEPALQRPRDRTR